MLPQGCVRIGGRDVCGDFADGAEVGLLPLGTSQRSGPGTADDVRVRRGDAETAAEHARVVPPGGAHLTARWHGVTVPAHTSGVRMASVFSDFARAVVTECGVRAIAD